MVEKQKERELLKGAGIQTKLNLMGDKVGVYKPGEFDRRVVKGQITLTQAEKDKLRKQVLIKAQFAAFKKYYPDLVDKNSIKYPIDDKLIAKMPELHGSSQLKASPTFKKVTLDSQDFENLLYIWEFLCNFSDFLSLPGFTLAEF